MEHSWQYQGNDGRGIGDWKCLNCGLKHTYKEDGGWLPESDCSGNRSTPERERRMTIDAVTEQYEVEMDDMGRLWLCIPGHPATPFTSKGDYPLQDMVCRKLEVGPGSIIEVSFKVVKREPHAK